MVVQDDCARLTQVFTALGIPTSSWYRQPVPEDQRRRPGPPRKVVEPRIAETVVKIATENPWYGYQRIAVMCRRLPEAVSDQDAYRVMRQQGLLQKRRVRRPELHHPARLRATMDGCLRPVWKLTSSVGLAPPSSPILPPLRVSLPPSSPDTTRALASGRWRSGEGCTTPWAAGSLPHQPRENKPLHSGQGILRRTEILFDGH